MTWVPKNRTNGESNTNNDVEVTEIEDESTEVTGEDCVRNCRFKVASIKIRYIFINLELYEKFVVELF